jgi:hypothetical protein
MSDLHLSEAELFFALPGTSATGEARRVEVEGRSGRRAFWGRLVPSRQTKPGRGYHLFAAPERDGAFGPVFGFEQAIFFERETPYLDAQMLAQKIRSLAHPSIGARFWRPAGADFSVALLCSGNGYALHFEQQRFRRGSLFWFDEAKSASFEEFLDWPDSELRALCARQFADETAPMRVAVDFDALSPEEKDARAFACARGDWNEMRRVFTLVWGIANARFGPIHTESGPFTWHFSDHTVPEEEKPSGQFLARWTSELWNYFGPAFRGREPMAHVFHRMSQLQNLFVSCSALGAHEHMEAQLQLRDWAHGKIPEERLSLLF